jgi:hypothetical protein
MNRIEEHPLLYAPGNLRHEAIYELAASIEELLFDIIPSCGF